MDVTIITTDPAEVQAADVAATLAKSGLYVHRVTVLDRHHVVGSEWEESN